MLEEESHLKSHFDKCFLINPPGVIGVEWGSFLKGQIPGVVGRGLEMYERHFSTVLFISNAF